MNNNIDTKKRHFLRWLLYSLIGTVLAAIPVLRVRLSGSASKYRSFLRPPGALPEKEFHQQCIGCFKCATSCPNQCIKMTGLEYGWENLNTPVINARSRGCTLCMRCTEVCPTGALQRVERDLAVISKEVKMGVAIVNEELCFSYAGRTCGACYRACPLQGKAMKIGVFEQPKVIAENCVGCGLCEQACIHLPQAVRVKPV